MIIVFSITVLLISSALAAPSEKMIRKKRESTDDINVSSQLNSECKYIITFSRADTTDMPELTLRYNINDVLASTPTHEGDIVLPEDELSVDITWEIPTGWIEPFYVTGKSMTGDDAQPLDDYIIEGDIIEHTVDDGPCTPGSAKRDPHMQTFDGYHYNFQGLCWYTLVKHCSDKPEFEISAMFAPRKSSLPEIKTRAVALNVTVGDERISMDRDSIMVNGEAYWVAQLAGRPRNANIVIDNGKVSIDIEKLKIEVTWDGHKHVFNAAILNSAYRGRVCGLLGNADSDPRNDIRMRDGRVTTDVDEFGESWKIPDKRCSY